MPRKKKPAVEIIRANPAPLALQDSGLEAGFNSKRVDYALRRLQSTFAIRQWQVYFARFGCIACHRKGSHSGKGFCGRCRARIFYRLRTIERQLTKAYEKQTGQEPAEQVVARVKAAERLLGTGRVSR